MLRPDQAAQISDELISMSAAELVAAKNVAAKRVSILYRVPELTPLEPWARAVIVENAKKEVMRKPSFSALWLLFSVPTIGIIWHLLKFAPLAKLASPMYLACAALVMSPVLVYKTVLIRRVIRENARAASI